MDGRLVALEVCKAREVGSRGTLLKVASPCPVYSQYCREGSPVMVNGIQDVRSFEKKFRVCS